MGSSQKLHFAQVGQFSTGKVGQFCIGTDTYAGRLSVASSSANSPIRKCGQNLGGDSDVAPHCPAWTRSSVLVVAGFIYIGYRFIDIHTHH
jgi:hypothetical protein